MNQPGNYDRNSNLSKENHTKELRGAGGGTGMPGPL